MAKKKSKKSKKKTTWKKLQPAANSESSSDEEPTPEAVPSTSKAVLPPHPPQQTKRPPPVLMRNVSRWTDFVKELKENNIGFSSAHSKPTGMKVRTDTTTDYNRLRRLMRTHNYEYYTFPPSGQKTIHYMVRHFPLDISVEAAEASITSMGYRPKKVMRLKNKSGDEVAMLLVVLPKDGKGKGFLQEEEIAEAAVAVEVQKKPAYVLQCHRCQKYGHIQRYCRSQPRCLKCAGEHYTNACTKAGDAPAVCHNCQGDHPANYVGCPAFQWRFKKET